MSMLSSLPTIQEIYSVNYILLVATDLCDDDGVCLASSVRRICSSRVLGGQPINFTQITGLCLRMKFIVQKTTRLVITPSAKQFVALNINRTYEISESQKSFLIEKTIFQGSWESHCRGFFLNFSPNYESFTFEFSIKDNPLPKKYSPVYQLLKNFRIIENRGGIIRVNPSYVRDVKNLLAKNNGFTQEQLRKLLNADEELGLRAEEAVLEYERKRLLNMGRSPESELVKRISQLDVSAGYDIASFDGETPSFTHDRFIEVKASKQGKIRFYWSSNEYEKAKELREQYWIYFIGKFGNVQQGEIEPVMIRDPVKRIEELSGFSIRVDKYVIEETNSLFPKEPN